jgi:UDP-N-acetylglucosamine 1-carboxyvinyltransferase
MIKGYVVRGGARLEGTVRVSGAKNAALPIMAASLLSAEPVELENVPALRDVDILLSLLEHLGVETQRREGGLVLRAARLATHEAPYELVKQMRASVMVLGPLLARNGIARVSLPGGCAIGERPVDQHIRGLGAMGARIDIRHGYIDASCDRLRGVRFRFDMPTVTGTENLMMAATLARGETILDNAAREPEVADLARLLTAMGADIEGAGEATIVIRGRDGLAGARHAVMPDRIEAATYLVAGAMSLGRVTVSGCIPEHVDAVLEKLAETGAMVTMDGEDVTVSASDLPRAVDLRTLPFPGFPTDVQSQFMAMLTRAQGVSAISETVFENRFMHVAELNRMGASIGIEGHTALVRGVPGLSGAPVMATDLRAGAALVMAGLVAEGETVVSRVYHLERGYEGMIAKFRNLGAELEEVWTT